MKKKLCSIILVFCLMATSLIGLTGCTLYHKNNERSSNEVVAVVGDEEITRNELSTWFNYYYYTCNMYYSQPAEDVYDMALKNLVKYKIIVNEAKHTEGLELTIADQNDIWSKVFEYIDQKVDDYEKEIKTRYGIETEEKEDEPETDSVVFTPYSRLTPNYSINYDQTETVLKNTYSAPTIDNYYRYLAYQKFVQELKDNYEQSSNKKVTVEEAFQKELENYYTFYENQKYAEKYNDYCLKNLVVSDEAIVNKYIEQLNTQIQDFSINNNFTSTRTSTSNNDLIVYNQTEGYFTVQQLLLSFSDTASISYGENTVKTSEYLASLPGFVFDKDEESSVEKSFVDAYLEERDNYAFNDPDSLDMTYIDPDTGKTTNADGEEIKKTYNEFKTELNSIYNEYTNSLSDIQLNMSLTNDEKESQSNDAARIFIQKFYKMKFSYSKDTNVTDLSSLFNKVGYTFTANKEDMPVSYVSEFNDAAYELYDIYKDTGRYSYKIVVSSYGVHVLVFTGEFQSGPVAESNIESLNSTYLSMISEQTIADYFYDKILNEMQTLTSGDNNYYFQAMIGSSISSVLYEKVSSILYNQYEVSNKIKLYYPTYEDIQ